MAMHRMRSKAMRQGYRLRDRHRAVKSLWGCSTPRSNASSSVDMTLSHPSLQPQLANFDNGKRDKLDKKIMEELQERSSEEEIEDDANSFGEVMVQKKLVEGGED